jgi:hypothetical protein
MKLIAGYQLLMDLEVTEDKGPPKATTSPEAKRRVINQDSREFLKLKRSLLAIKKCEVCHNMYCSCLKPVQDKSLMKLTKRLERLHRKPALSPSLEQTKSLGAIRSHRKSADCRSPVKPAKTNESCGTFKTSLGQSPQSEIINVELRKPRRIEVSLKAYGHSLRSASENKPHRE